MPPRTGHIALAAGGIKATSLGLSEWVRIAVPAEPTARRLLAAWRAALAASHEARA